MNTQQEQLETITHQLAPVELTPFRLFSSKQPAIRLVPSKLVSPARTSEGFVAKT